MRPTARALLFGLALIILAPLIAGWISKLAPKPTGPQFVDANTAFYNLAHPEDKSWAPY